LTWEDNSGLSRLIPVQLIKRVFVNQKRQRNDRSRVRKGDMVTERGGAQREKSEAPRQLA
jgi:RNA-binding protein YlmH